MKEDRLGPEQPPTEESYDRAHDDAGGTSPCGGVPAREPDHDARDGDAKRRPSGDDAPLRERRPQTLRLDALIGMGRAADRAEPARLVRDQPGLSRPSGERPGARASLR